MTTTAVAQTPPPRRTLFAITADLAALDQLLEERGGDVSDPAVLAAVESWYADLAAEEAAKLDGWCNWVRQLDMEAHAARVESAEYAKRAQAREATLRWAKARMLDHLLATGRTKAVTASGRTVAVQQNGGVLPLECSTFTQDHLANEVDPRFVLTTLAIDTAAVRAAVDAGEQLPFARYGERGFQLRIRG